MYLTLPSNSSNSLYPNNTPAKYKVRLQRELLLEAGEWEVGLAEIHFPYNRRLPPTLQVCCNIIDHQLVGNGIRPLLRIISIKGKKAGDVISQVFERPHYIPVSGGAVRDVEISICDNSTEILSTPYGPVTVVLHLRRVKEPYFHI